MSEATRRVALEALLDLRRNPGSLADLLHECTMGETKPLVTLTRARLCSVLEEVVMGRVPKGHLLLWAELVGSRSDIGLESGHEDVLRDCLLDLAGLLRFGPVDEETTARRWLSRLAGTSGRV